MWRHVLVSVLTVLAFQAVAKAEPLAYRVRPDNAKVGRYQFSVIIRRHDQQPAGQGADSTVYVVVRPPPGAPASTSLILHLVITDKGVSRELLSGQLAPLDMEIKKEIIEEGDVPIGPEDSIVFKFDIGNECIRESALDYEIVSPSGGIVAGCHLVLTDWLPAKAKEP